MRSLFKIQDYQNSVPFKLLTDGDGYNYEMSCHTDFRVVWRNNLRRILY